jgi:hypothetical protein
MTNEVTKKAMTATISSGSSTLREKAGGAICAKHRAAMMAAKTDETKLPTRDRNYDDYNEEESSRSNSEMQSVTDNGK